MELITYEVPATLNYGYEGAEYRGVFIKAYNRLLNLFESRQVDGQTGMCYVPAQWAGIISHIIREMVSIDPKIEFNTIYEKYGKLSIDFVPSRADETLIIELLDSTHDAQNRVDNLTHGMVSRRLPKCEQSIKDNEWLLMKGILNTAL